MDNQPAQLLIHLDAGPDSDRREQAELTQDLRANLLHLDVDSVEAVRAATAPPGAKGDPMTLTSLAIGLAPVALTELMKVLQTWLSRHDRASVTVERGGEKLVVTGSPSKEQKQLIDAFVRRHAP